MVDHPTNLDAHRGKAAQKATDLRRLRSEVEADQAALHARITVVTTRLSPLGVQRGLRLFDARMDRGLSPPSCQTCSAHAKGPALGRVKGGVGAVDHSPTGSLQIANPGRLEAGLGPSV